MGECPNEVGMWELATTKLGDTNKKNHNSKNIQQLVQHLLAPTRSTVPVVSKPHQEGFEETQDQE